MLNLIEGYKSCLFIYVNIYSNGKNIVVTKCPSGMFRCNDGLCLDERRRCDGRPHCRDGSDEINCRTNNYLFTIDVYIYLLKCISCFNQLRYFIILCFYNNRLFFRHSLLARRMSIQDFQDVY